MSAYIKSLPFRLGRLLICILVAFSILCSPIRALGISAQSAILIDASTGQVLFESNANQRMPMASTTKIMTAVVAIESMELSTKIKIPKEAVGIEGSSIYLCEGEILTLEELLYALMLSSANDAAVAISIAVAGSVEQFAVLMNQTAQRLGLENTHFENPNGLDSAEHYTTAHDLAKLTAYALSIPKFCEIASTYKRSIPLNGQPNARLLVNHNKLLRSYDGAIGVKTGFTKKSGRCLVSAARREDMTLIAVTLNAPDDWRDHKTMLDFGFSNYDSVLLGDFSMELPLISGERTIVRCASDNKEFKLLPADHGEISCVVELYPFVYAPVELGEKLGDLVYYLDGDEIARFDISATESIKAINQKRPIWDIIFGKQ